MEGLIGIHRIHRIYHLKKGFGGNSTKIFHKEEDIHQGLLEIHLYMDMTKYLAGRDIQPVRRKE